MRNRRFLLLMGALLWWLPYLAEAQIPADSVRRADTVQIAPAVQTVSAPTDTALIPGSRKYAPRKATLLSLALPGAGQAYNRRYWKIPLIYAGFGTLGYFIVRWNNLYQDFAAAYLQKLATPSEPVPVAQYSDLPSAERYREGRELYRRYRDLNIILTAALWMLNVVDANVDAHLKGFDLSDDLALRLQPGCPPGTLGQPAAGVTIALILK